MAQGRLNASNIHLNSEPMIKLTAVIVVIELSPARATIRNDPEMRMRKEVREI